MKARKLKCNDKPPVSPVRKYSKSNPPLSQPKQRLYNGVLQLEPRQFELGHFKFPAIFQNYFPWICPSVHLISAILNSCYFDVLFFASSENLK